MNALSSASTLKLNVYCPTLEELSARLMEYETVRQAFKIANPQSAGTRFDSREDFDARGWILQERDARRYKVKGHSLYIVVGEDFALQLDAVRALRLAAAQEQDQSQAKQKLEAHPYGKRALPEDLLVHIDELPDSGLFQRVLLLDETNVEDIWLSQTYVNNFISSAAVEPNGDLLFFKRDAESFLRDDLFHEWGHRLEKKLPEDVRLFEQAISLEMAQENAYQLSLYAGRNTSEHWAVAVEHLLGENTERFLDFAEKAPLRAVLIAGAVKKGSLAGEPGAGCKQHAVFQARISHVELDARPRARKFLAGLEQGENVKKLADCLEV